MQEAKINMRIWGNYKGKYHWQNLHRQDGIGKTKQLLSKTKENTRYMFLQLTHAFRKLLLRAQKVLFTAAEPLTT